MNMRIFVAIAASLAASAMLRAQEAEGAGAEPDAAQGI